MAKPSEYGVTLTGVSTALGHRGFKVAYSGGGGGYTRGIAFREILDQIDREVDIIRDGRGFITDIRPHSNGD